MIYLNGPTHPRYFDNVAKISSHSQTFLVATGMNGLIFINAFAIHLIFVKASNLQVTCMPQEINTPITFKISQ